MGFTTPCFIRKNTLELRKKLEELGYNHPIDVIEDERFCIATSPVNCNYHIIIKGAFDDTNPHYTWNCAGRIDCGTNEELFLAIAALRDDTNYMQWFVCTSDYKESDDKEWKVGDFDLNTCPDDFDDILPHWRKATVNELIELFSPKIQVPQIEWNINDVINKD